MGNIVSSEMSALLTILVMGTENFRLARVCPFPRRSGLLLSLYIKLHWQKMTLSFVCTEGTRDLTVDLPFLTFKY